MIDINLLPEERRKAPAAAFRPGRLIACCCLAALALLNAYYAWMVVPALEREAAAREDTLRARAEEAADVRRAEFLLTERTRRINAAKALYGKRRTWAEALAGIKSAVNGADASLEGGAAGGTLWLDGMDGGERRVALKGRIAGAAGTPIESAVDGVAQGISDVFAGGSTVEKVEPDADAVPGGYARAWRFAVDAGGE